MTDPLPSLPPRDPKGHKGTFGTVVVVGGSAGSDGTEAGGRRMIGAPALAARAALRAGAGLARLVMPAPVLNAGISLCPSATGVPIPVDPGSAGVGGAILPHEASRILDEQIQDCQCLVIGPGMGAGEGVRAMAVRALQQEQTPVIVDADALNALAQVPELARDLHAAAVLTPHPGEYRRLAGSLNVSLDPVKPESRADAAMSLAQRTGCIVVLKGPATVVSDGQRTWTDDAGAGGAELATAGTGDVLAGLLGGLVAQFVSIPAHPKIPPPPGRPLDLFDAARLAVRAHGLAGQSWARTHHAKAGLLATELADELPRVLAGL